MGSNEDTSKRVTLFNQKAGNQAALSSTALAKITAPNSEQDVASLTRHQTHGMQHSETLVEFTSKRVLNFNSQTGEQAALSRTALAEIAAQNPEQDVASLTRHHTHGAQHSGEKNSGSLWRKEAIKRKGSCSILTSRAWRVWSPSNLTMGHAGYKGGKDL